jgi:hypothetical protein
LHWFLASPILITLTWDLVSALQALTSEKLRFARRYSSNAGSRSSGCSGVDAIRVLISRVSREGGVESKGAGVLPFDGGVWG